MLSETSSFALAYCEEIDESTESYTEWLSAFESACPQWKA